MTNASMLFLSSFCAVQFSSVAVRFLHSWATTDPQMQLPSTDTETKFIEHTFSASSEHVVWTRQGRPSNVSSCFKKLCNFVHFIQAEPLSNKKKKEKEPLGGWVLLMGHFKRNGAPGGSERFGKAYCPGEHLNECGKCPRPPPPLKPGNENLERATVVKIAHINLFLLSLHLTRLFVVSTEAFRIVGGSPGYYKC